MPFIWSDAKTRLLEFQTDTCVSAGAGTGKTAALVELYTRLLTDRTRRIYPEPVTHDRIVCLTFTEKAARQMQERVLARLMELDDEARSAFLRLGNEAIISTFHGFCARLLRRHPFEAGLPGRFEVADEPTSQLWLDQAIRATLAEALERNDPDLREILAGFDLRTVARLLVRLAGGEVFPAEAALPLAEEAELLLRWREQSRAVLEEIAPLREGVPGRTGPEGGKARTTQGKWEEERRQTVVSLLKMGDWIGGSEREGIPRFVRSGLSTGKLPPLPALTGEEAKGLRARFETLGEIGKEIWLCRLEAAWIGLSRRTRDFYDRLKLRNGALDFHDLETRALRLLEENAPIRDAWRRQIHILMVDEFQDTNPLQKRLIDLLKRDSAWNLPPNRFLFVGDRKQSIYRFRGADVRVFNAIEREFAAGAGGQVIRFDDNFRSRPELLALFNGLFAIALAPFDPDQPKDFETGYQSADDLRCGLPIDPAPHPCAEMIVVADRKSVQAQRRAEGRAIGRRLREICAPDSPVRVRDRDRGTWRLPRYDDIALLLRRMTHAGAYEQGLREAGIPYVISRGEGLWERREVRDLVNLASFLVQPLEPMTRLAVLRSPAFLLSDPMAAALMRLDAADWSPERFNRETWSRLIEEGTWPGFGPALRRDLLDTIDRFDALRRRLPFLSPSQVLERFCEDFDLFRVAEHLEDAERQKSNMMKFLEKTRQWERSVPGASLEGFLDAAANWRRFAPHETEGVPELGRPAVVCMTIHQAKGLEFPVVVLADLGHSDLVRSESVQLLPDGRVGLCLPRFASENSLQNGRYAEAVNRNREEERAESARLFYVAATRAMDYLIFSGDECDPEKRKGNGTWMDLLTEYLTREDVSISQTFVSPDSECPAPPRRPPSDWPTVTHRGARDSLPKGVRTGDLGLLTVTQLLDLSVCPRLFLLRRRIDPSFSLWMDPAPPEAPDIPEKTDVQVVGTLVHHFLEHLHSPEQLTREAFLRFAREVGLPDDPEWSRLGLRLEALSNHLNVHAFFDSTLRRELPFLARVTLPSGSRLKVKGRIDAVRERPDGSLELWDYKYAKKREESAEIYARQMIAYAEVLTQAGYTVEAALLIYLKDFNPVSPVDLSEATRVRFWEDLSERLEAARDMADLPPKQWSGLDPDRCERRRCPFLGLCHPHRTTARPAAENPSEREEETT